MNNLWSIFISKLELIISVLILSLLTSIYRVTFSSRRMKAMTWKGLLTAILSDLVADFIIILSLLILEHLGMDLHPMIYVFMVMGASTILNWWFTNQMKVVDELAHHWINRYKKSDTDEAANDE